MLHDLVGRQTLPSAVRLNSSLRNVGFLAGPAVGSVFLLALGPAFGILANVLVYQPLTIWLMGGCVQGCHTRLPRHACAAAF
jgi:hypothetical protein